MKKLFYISITLFSFLWTACSSSTDSKSTPDQEIPSKDDQMINDSTSLVLTNGSIKLTEVVGSPEFPDSKLSILSPAINSNEEVGAVNFNFKIDGGKYELGSQSVDAHSKGCSNSDKGQHIHLILNNAPYQASYTTDFDSKELEAGNYVALAFISRSYHESLKHKGAYALTQFKVGEEEMDEIDLDAPHLFYSRPKGDYKEGDTENIMLDFYLVNTEIKENGNYVQVTFNNETEFKIKKWAPYFVQGLPLGTNTVKIELYNEKGEFIEGPFNSETRSFNLLKS